MNRSTLILVSAVLAASPLVADESDFYSINGEGNNEDNPTWGAVDVELIRVAGSDYEDEISAPAGGDRRSPREISNIVLDQGDKSIPNDRRMSDIVWQWGQFLDHDIDLTEPASPPEPFNIPVPDGDPFFDPFGTGEEEIALNRSIFHVVNGVREQLNEITAFIDGSNVYGSDEATATFLREGTGGRLRTTPSEHGDLLPRDDFDFFVAGDIRVNEQAYLTAMHTLWMREHNRIADKLADELADELPRSKKKRDELLYQRARRMVIAELQAITYNEFLPALLGQSAIPPYVEYSPTVNPGILNEFSTAAFRLGHSMLNSTLLRLDNDGNSIGSLSLQDAFFDPTLITGLGIEPYLKGLTAQAAQEIDSKIVGDVRNFLFPSLGGFDLGSLNIQRGRDHGLPDYNTVRAELGLPPVNSFKEITRNGLVRNQLKEAYENDVDNMDLWVGAIAEDHVPGGSVGPVVREILVWQFMNLRDGDRFWYENIYEGDELNKLRATTLSEVIERNTNLTNLPDNVFFISGRSK